MLERISMRGYRLCTTRAGGFVFPPPKGVTL
jgi:hypothetical protein